MRVTLISRPACHLCDDARAVVLRVAAEVGAEVEELSLDGESPVLVDGRRVADLRSRYGELVPVVLVDGRQLAYWRVDADRLRAALTGGPTGARRWLRRRG